MTIRVIPINYIQNIMKILWVSWDKQEYTQNGCCFLTIITRIYVHISWKNIEQLTRNRETCPQMIPKISWNDLQQRAISHIIFFQFSNQQTIIKIVSTQFNKKKFNFPKKEKYRKKNRKYSNNRNMLWAFLMQWLLD